MKPVTINSVLTAVLFLTLCMLQADTLQAVTLCNSSSNPTTSTSILLEYQNIPPIIVPAVVGNLSGNQLEIQHSVNYPLPGLRQRGVVPAGSSAPSCTGIPNQGGSGYTNGACDGKLTIMVSRDSQPITKGFVDVHILEVNNNISQQNITDTFTLWPACASGGIVPCQPGDTYALLYANFINTVTPFTRQYSQNVLNIATVRISQVTPTVIRSNGTDPEFLHFLTNLGTPPPDSQWFAFAALDSCIQVSKLMPLKHL